MAGEFNVTICIYHQTVDISFDVTQSGLRFESTPRRNQIITFFANEFCRTFQFRQLKPIRLKLGAIEARKEKSVKSISSSNGKEAREISSSLFFNKPLHLLMLFMNENALNFTPSQTQKEIYHRVALILFLSTRKLIRLTLNTSLSF